MPKESKENIVRGESRMFMDRLINISKTRGYEPLKYIFAPIIYDPASLPEQMILTSKWRYTFKRLSTGYWDLDVLGSREPTSWNPRGDELTVRVRLEYPIAFPSAELLDVFISDLEEVI